MNAIADRTLARAKRHGAGWVFSAKHLSDLGTRAAVDQALSRLVKDGNIRRLARGLYDLPQVHPVLGLLSPNPDAVASAAAEQAGHRLQISPARAANALGLSSQVPAKMVYLTDGSSRKIRVGKQVIYLKHAGPRALLGAGTKAGVALQALRAVGKDNLTDGVVRHLRNNLPPDTKVGLRKLMHKAPQWTAPVIDAITA
jgi:predicted transcriptional regulator of viral defense system